MRVWLVRDLEPIPSDPGDRRLMRAGMLAAALAARGHETVWFTSSFDHYRKRQRSAVDQTLHPAPNLTIELLHGPGYSRNISLGRIAHNRQFARRWLDHAAASAARPDVLVTDIPSTETADAVVKFGLAQGIPTVVSVRDLWPDFFVDFLPKSLRPLAKPLLLPLDRQARRASAGATSLLGVSEGYLEWGRAKGGRPANTLDRVFPLGYAARPEPGPPDVQALRERLGLGGRTLVSFVGSWGATYDLGLLDETARALGHRQDLALVITGDSDSRPELRDKLAKLNNVVLAGWLGADDIARLVSTSAIGLLPYRAKAPQGLPNKVFEYMAYGAYQVATLKGEIEGFYAGTGAGRVAGAAPDVLAQAIEAALPEAVDPVARAARIARFHQSYSADAVYGAMVDHIELVAR